MYRLLEAPSTLNAVMHSQSVDTIKLSNIRSFYERVRKLGRGVLRFHFAMPTLNR